MKNLQQCGNLLKYISGDCDIQILRVYGYGSITVDTIYDKEEDRLSDNLNSFFFTVWQNIPRDWRDNKIVVEVQIGPWRLFLGYYDFSRSIGYGVSPNMYLPKANTDKWGKVKSINISRK